jgi:hypothetical protein
MTVPVPIALKIPGCDGGGGGGGGAPAASAVAVADEALFDVFVSKSLSTVELTVTPPGWLIA